MSNNEIKKELIRDFLHTDSNVLNTYRTLLLFGRNSATYKFALCNSIMKLKPTSELRYDDLRDTFMNEILRHYKNCSSQFQSGPNRLTKAIDLYLASDQTEAEWGKLLVVAEKNIYNNVFDAFQRVGNGSISNDFLLFEHDKESKKLILTDNTLQILEDPIQCDIVVAECESRWSVVAEAWRAGLAPNMLEYDNQTKTFYSTTRNHRIGLRSAVNTLKPYQKGKCFYCNKPLQTNVDKEHDAFPDVDHFLPLSLLIRRPEFTLNANGVWNLVIACKGCNRGNLGKFMAPPDHSFYEKLIIRNRFFVEEHKHSLRNSIFLSLGAASANEVESKMRDIFKFFQILNGWKPSIIYP